MKKIFETAQVFRANGNSVSHPLATMKMGKQLEQANYQGASIVVYVDGDKAAKGQFEFKDLRDGTMHVGDVAAIVERLSTEVKKKE